MTGERSEALAFTFCKCATLVLLTGRYALLVASVGASLFYTVAYFKGKTDTKCVMKYPLLIAAFWGIIAAFMVFKMTTAAAG
jgi:hypothetical protein